jgi:hypothetical protein
MKNKLALILGSTTLAVISTVLTVSAQAASAGEVKSQVTGLCLDSDNNGYVYTKGCNGGGYQNWNFSQNGSNWILKNAATGRCLDSDGPGKVYTKGCNGGGYQNWEFSAGNFGQYKNAATGRCLDSDNNGEVYAYGCRPHFKGQRWHS